MERRASIVFDPTGLPLEDWRELLEESGETLRSQAVVEPGREGRAPKLEVGPVGVGPEHPASTLRGSESFVAFPTDRHDEYPLIAQGAGAGGAVTASGVLTDILRIANRLRGR